MTRLLRILLGVTVYAMLCVLALSTTVHSWRDITVGTESTYCGIALGHGVDLYCQTGH